MFKKNFKLRKNNYYENRSCNSVFYIVNNALTINTKNYVVSRAGYIIYIYIFTSQLQLTSTNVLKYNNI